MLEAAETVAAFISGRDRAALDQDRMLLFALVRAIEILGEAATKLSAETRLAAPDVPWSQITAMRNRSIHAYFEIDANILWRTAEEEIPALRKSLLALIGNP
jgi:uncharacterized protein with HEPN domain